MWQDGVFAGSFSPCPWPGPPCCAQQTTQRDEETCQLLQSRCFTCSFCPSIIPNTTLFLSQFFWHLSLYSCASLLYSLSLSDPKQNEVRSKLTFQLCSILCSRNRPTCAGRSPVNVCVLPDYWELGSLLSALQSRAMTWPLKQTILFPKIIFLSSFKVSC